MFLAAAPYFQRRFDSDPALLRNFQSAILSVSTVGGLGSMIVLTKLQARANYPKRITMALGINAVVFTLLALSTKLFLDVSTRVYFAFLMVMVLSASLASGMCQNGVFAYVSSFRRDEYTQGIMAGQGVAGVLPCIAQIVSVLSVPKNKHAQGSPQVPNTSAFAYFLTATLVSTATLAAFSYLLSTKRVTHTLHHTTDDDAESASPHERKPIPLTTLLRKLIYLASAVALTFTITMFFPVFTQQILSTHNPATSPRLFQPATFIPLAFLFWNAGDLLGRTLPAVPALRLTAYPRLLLLLAVLRIGFIPLYWLCNIGGRGAAVESDFFYLVVVQLLFGVSNGFLGSSCMMGFGEWVEDDERAAAGGLMSLCLISGLTVGSFLTFFAT
ncbi:hypothetical protein P153DRAFT_369515 [Dothidotthia symphoricarpi CBS 119687]|uniref:Nucleoside transporter family n=1 Tax=Dothidotthia symphoricarpi CBS 119687 TaxID=1392245 RepID=A0A6A6A5H1_9PLEO|nr:uncharacterized protein P153DRAFT_369515 [Dothidotthia symphoricarpi CBS 119687]KAF2126157.1 hypothetical protein P153DRAFT_369515 [Dothidotthia symphoricarpi CBS 119687]